MKYLSLFSGIGGFELGIIQAYEQIHNMGRTTETSNTKNRRHQSMFDISDGDGRRSNTSCIGFSEIDKYATEVYQKHFPTHKNYGDITTINEKELPEFELLVGGFPCQSFSIAGKRRGFEDTRGTLFFDIVRIIREKQPRLLLLENVKGLISHDKGKTLETILESLQELGYYVNIEVYNSKDFGVPQNRERIIFICKHIKTIIKDGENLNLNISREIIEQYLFQILLNNLVEVKKLQEVKSKDWVLAWLLWKEMNQNIQNQDINENIKGGTWTPTEEDKSRSVESLWQSIDTLLNKNLVENLNEQSKYTTLTEIKQIIESKTYTFLQMQRAILLLIGDLRNSQKNLWNEVLSNLIVIKENTKYARINDKKEEVVITETGNAYLNKDIQANEQFVAFANLRGTPRPEVFPFGGGGKEVVGKETRGVQANCLTATCHKGAGNDGMTLLQLNKPTHSNDRVYGTDGLSPTLNTMQGGNRHPFIPEDIRIRRLTPTECERLQGFPDVEKSVILQVCTENLNNPAYAESQSHKLQKLVGSVEKNNSQDNVVSATESLITSSQQTSKPAQPDVLINCVENGVEIHSQGRLLLNARGVAKKNWSPQHMEIEDFVQVVAGINTILEKITKHGGVESHLNEQCLILQKNGKKFVRLCGKEMTQIAEDVKNDSTTLKKLLKSITSDHSDIKSLEQRLITLFSFVSLAIVGYIPTEIQSQSICTIEIKSKLGWTFGISDTQRYKCCGNAVTVNVIKDICLLLLTK